MQTVLEEALGAVTGEPVAVTGAGRTDTGVHATGQVVHFDTDWMHGNDALERAANAALPRDVALCELSEVAPDFHARHDALARWYRYRIVAAPVRRPLLRRTAHHVREPLDAARMVEAARRLLGRHDFGAFGRPARPGGGTERVMFAVDVSRDGEIVTVTLAANAFLRHQVRRTVGLLLDVGRGRRDVAAMSAVLDRNADAPIPWRAPARGLEFAGVAYTLDEAPVDIRRGIVEYDMAEPPWRRRSRIGRV